MTTPTLDDASERFSLIEMDLPRPSAPAPTVRQPIPVVAALVEVPMAPTTLVDDLTAIATAGASNAAVQGIGSMAGGQLRGVGFTSRDGYITAIRNGVPNATYQIYLQTLRAQYGMTSADIAALQLPGPMVETALPVGPGIKHVPTGPSIFDRPRAERAFVVAPSTEVTEAPAVIKLEHGQLIAGAVAEGSGVLVGWSGKGKLTRGALVEAIAELGVKAPIATSARAQAGRVMSSLTGLGFGVGWYVPARHAHAAGELCAVVSKIWGTDWIVPALPVATSNQLRDGIVRGLMAEVDALMARLATERGNAQTEYEDRVATHKATQSDLVRGRGDIGPKRGQTFLSELRAIGQRIVAYGQVLGEERVADARDLVRHAVVELETVLGEDHSGISQRFAAVWEEIELDRKRSGGVL